MSDQTETQLAEVLGQVGGTLDQILETQRERTRSMIEWHAADIKFRQELIQSQQAILASAKGEQRVRRLAQAIIVVAGVIALLVITVSWVAGWRP